MIVSPGPNDFYKLTRIPKDALEWLKYEVPSEYRYYDSKDGQRGHWYIHEKHLLSVIELAYKQLGHVDYSSLSDYIQAEIAKAAGNWQVNRQKTSGVFSAPSMSLVDAYSTLHLNSSASFGLVSSAWKYLARETHPDRGGNAELFRKYSEAFERIKKEESK